MKARAIAVASERSNAVGTVELECTPEGLVIGYLGVAAFAEDYAPGAVTTGTRVLVPWALVREARVEGDQLYLHVAEQLTPHNRLVLVNFSTGDAPHRVQLRRQRLMLRGGLIAAFIVIVLVTALTLPRFAPDAGAAAVLAVGCTAALGLLAFGIFADYRITHGGADADTTRATLAGELAMYLPHLNVSRVRPPRTLPAALPSFQAMLPRSTAAIVITMSAALLGAVLTSSWVLRERNERRDSESRAARVEAREEPIAAAVPVEPPPPRPPTAPTPTSPPPPPPASPPPAAAPSAAPGSATAAAVAVGAPCTCERADSLLWESPIPRLSTLVIDRREKPHKNHIDLELELAVINNGDQDIRDLSMRVQFFERDPPPSSKRSPTENRALFFEGPLKPGQAIKWHVEEEGTEFEVDHGIEGEIHASGDNAAPTNRFAELLDAIHRPVRLHGAMMLGYFGDPRAKDGALKLRDALRDEEAPYLDRLLRALADVYSCHLRVEGDGRLRTVEACVFNSTRDAKAGLGMRVRALDRKFDFTRPVAPPPLVITETLYTVPGTVPAKSGVTARVTFDSENPDGVVPQSFEAFAAPMDEL